MVELLGIGIAELFGLTVANAFMDGVAALDGIRWASLDLFVTQGVDGE